MADDEDVDLGQGSSLSPDVEMEDDPSVKRRGRGFDPRGEGPAQDGVRHRGGFDILDSSKRMDEDGGERIAGVSEDRVAKSIEGYIIVVTGIHEEATEEEVTDKFADYGHVKDCHLNLDRRTGYVKGYALLEYATRDEAKAAIDACKEGDLTLMDEPLKADFAFMQPPASARSGQRSSGRGRRDDRHRSRSPGRG